MAAFASTLMPTGRPVARRTRSVITAMHGSRLGPDVVRLEERDVAVVLDDQPVEPGCGIGLGIRYRAGVDFLHRLARIARARPAAATRA